jgi:hypothetical protein
MTSTRSLVIIGALFACIAIGVTLLLSLGKSSAPTASNGPTGFSFPAGVPVDTYSTTFVTNFFQGMLSMCKQSADMTIQQRGVAIDAAMSAKVDRACGCAADYVTASLTDDDVHAHGVTAHEHDLIAQARTRCQP